jgi:predicted lipid-binding transport protein (Tim44 family)
MSTLGTIAIVAGALVVLTLVAILVMEARRKRLDSRREEAGELRKDAQRQGRLAERQRAEADERAARAKKAEAEAEEKAAQARRESALAEQRASVAGRQERFARDRHDEARSVDPDVDDDGADHDREAPTRSA